MSFLLTCWVDDFSREFPSPKKKLKVELFKFSKDTFLVAWQIAMENIHFSCEIPSKYWINLPAGYVSLPSREWPHISPNGKLGKASTQECRLGWDMLVPRKVPHNIHIRLVFRHIELPDGLLASPLRPSSSSSLVKRNTARLKEGMKFNPTTGLNNLFDIHTLICCI